MFKVEEKRFGKCIEYAISNARTGESVRVANLGANTLNLTLKPSDRDGPPMSVLLGYDTPEQLEEGRWSRGIKMMPFPNRIQDGRYAFGGRTYRLPINFPSQNHAIHGLLSKETMGLRESEEGSSQGSVTLEYDFTGKFGGYPFGLYVNVKHTLTEDGLKVETTAENIGTESLPFGDGWHPYFRFDGRCDVNNWELKIPAKRRVKMSERLIPTGDLLPVEGTEYDFLKRRRIGAMSLDNVFTSLSREKGFSVTELRNATLDVALEVWQDQAYDYLVIFTPPGENRNCVAIEPMTCNTNAFNNGQGLIVLKPGDRFRGSYGVRMR